MEAGICQKYLNVLANISDVIMMIDLRCDGVIWMSEKFKSNYPDLNIGSSTDELLCVFKKLNIDTASLQRKIVLYQAGNQLPDVYCDENNMEIYHLGDSVLSIRMQNKTHTQLAQSRYLQDREELLFTSRSITVSEMASTLAHEINQPVGTIHNLLYGIKVRLSGVEGIDQDIFSAIDMSLEQTKYTSDIIARIRDYTHSRKPKQSVVEIKLLIEKCVSLMDWEMRHTNIEIQHYPDISNAKILGDELMLQQVIVNLIRNGMEANAESEKSDNKIKIVTSRSDNNIEIHIIDNGKGLSDKEADSIFIPFASNKSTGMGIGLNICRSFIELHKGKLWLSKNDTIGCTSHIVLPVLL
jgi:two-component system, LuxR family, sensor kinase FixL